MTVDGHSPPIDICPYETNVGSRNDGVVLNELLGAQLGCLDRI